MDTDDLSDQAYNGVIIEAERFNHDLTLRFGVIAEFCEDEEAYLIKAKSLIKAIRRLDRHGLDDMFFGSPPNKNKLDLTLDKILNNILALEKKYAK